MNSKSTSCTAKTCSMLKDSAMNPGVLHEQAVKQVKQVKHEKWDKVENRNEELVDLLRHVKESDSIVNGIDEQGFHGQARTVPANS